MLKRGSVLVVAVLALGTSGPAQAAATAVYRPGCAIPSRAGAAVCYLAVRPVPRGALAPATSCVSDPNAGYRPCDIQAAYGLTALSASRHGRTVAVIDAYDDPNAEADLGVYRSTYGLPACTTANKCFRKVNQSGVRGHYPSPDAGWAQETSLDLDMVSAVCPNCHILLVEADSSGFGDLFAALHEAIVLKAKVVSDSWGTGEFDGETGFDATLDAPGVSITFSSGDGAYQGGVQYPSASPYITSVGGTQLTPAANPRGFTERAWAGTGTPPTQGSGSGCSAYEGKPAWQSDPGCANRTTADVSAVAADVLSYDTYDSGGTWFFSFGTSVSSPIIAGIYGLSTGTSPTVVPASVAYTAAANSRYDIKSGSTGTCTPTYLCRAVAGYDGPTGMGTPHGVRSYTVANSPGPTVTSLTETGPTSDPTITISGADLGAFPPPGAPESCNSGDTGDVFGAVGLSLSDLTAGWTAGQTGDCIGLIIDSWSPTSASFSFGNRYANYPPAQTGDSYSFELQGSTFSGQLT